MAPPTGRSHTALCSQNTVSRYSPCTLQLCGSASSETQVWVLVHGIDRHANRGSALPASHGSPQRAGSCRPASFPQAAWQSGCRRKTPSAVATHHCDAVAVRRNHVTLQLHGRRHGCAGQHLTALDRVRSQQGDVHRCAWCHGDPHRLQRRPQVLRGKVVGGRRIRCTPQTRRCSGTKSFPHAPSRGIGNRVSCATAMEENKPADSSKIEARRGMERISSGAADMT